MTGYLTAILAFRPSITHHTPSVFDADQRGIGQFFLSGLGTWKSGLNLNPMGDPTISSARSWFFSILHGREVVRHSKISHLKLFPDPLQPSGWSSGAIPIPMRDSMEFCLLDMAYVIGLNLKELANLKSMLLVGSQSEQKWRRSRQFLRVIIKC